MRGVTQLLRLPALCLEQRRPMVALQLCVQRHSRAQRKFLCDCTLMHVDTHVAPSISVKLLIQFSTFFERCIQVGSPINLSVRVSNLSENIYPSLCWSNVRMRVRRRTADFGPDTSYFLDWSPAGASMTHIDKQQASHSRSH